MASLLAAPYSTFLDANGLPLNGGMIYSYSSGTNTPKATYTDVSGLIPATNPVILDAAGRAAIWLDGTYRISVRDSLGNIIRTTDNISSSNSGGTTTSTSFRNSLMNGDMTLSQRTGPFTGISGFATPVYTLDRWFAWTGGTASMSVSQQAGTGNFANLMRIQRANGNANTATLFMGQIIESIDCAPLATQTITVSFYARAGANFSATSSLMNIRCQVGTGTDQGSASYTNGTWSGAVLALNTTQAINTTLTRYSFTTAIGSGYNEVAVDFGFAPTGTAGAADYIEVTGVQLEIGALSAFEQVPYGTNYQRCLRYFQIFNTFGTSVPLTTGMCYSTTAFLVVLPIFPKRSLPTGITIDSVAGYQVYNASASPVNLSTLVFAAPGYNQITLTGTVASGLVAGNATTLVNASGSHSIAINGTDL